MNPARTVAAVRLLWGAVLLVAPRAVLTVASASAFRAATTTTVLATSKES